MRLNRAFVAVGLIASTNGALEAPVYTFDHPSTPIKKNDNLLSISPQDARLFLTHRLGLSRYHNLQDAGDDAIQLLNGYGGTQAPLFGADEEEDSRLRRLLVIVDGVEKPQGPS